MSPVRIKLYGLIPITRRRYLAQVVVALILAVGLLLAWWLYWPGYRAKIEAIDSPLQENVIVWLNIAPVVILCAVGLQAIEAWFVFRLFSSRQTSSPTTPLTSSGTTSSPDTSYQEFPMAMQHSPRFQAIVKDAKSRIKETTVDIVKSRLDRGEQLTIIDVREESEFAKDHVPGAIHLGKGVIERDIEARVPNPSTEVILYCGGGFRSALAADNLQKMGYTNVVSMDGGMRDWRNRGFPLTS